MSRIEILDKANPADARAFEAWWAENKDRWLGFKVCAAAAWIGALHHERSAASGIKGSALKLGAAR